MIPVDWWRFGINVPQQIVLAEELLFDCPSGVCFEVL